VPTVRAYDPAYAYEVALIIHDGLRRMLREHEDIMYYLTLYNENYVMPSMPEGVEEGILRGAYLLRPASVTGGIHAQILGSGTILRETLRAQEILRDRWNVAADVWSVTSYSELRRDATRSHASATTCYILKVSRGRRLWFLRWARAKGRSWR
jgi:pyruvate dehydrogenase E1 component